ncbi:hypothetical protein BamMEX5DRAFT_7004 [Burkholderia ambifaria MEX-5]|uniref:Uncharacterized protein n=1 Tax=Burkholderia ambifaria MEX-5 TaxID=396597 RepID=B1TGT8_9BURK|nr:hypothetical protein BamMEX5DRAFT_7004 [Burkholderia ambifaria MEX-5]
MRSAYTPSWFWYDTTFAPCFAQYAFAYASCVVPCSTPIDLPFSDSAVGSSGEPFFTTSRVGWL